MAGRCLLMVLVLTATDPDPGALVARLGSQNRGERESAAAALEALGPKALGALRAARDGRDPDLKRQAVVLIKKIEADALTRPALVSLDFHDRPMSEVIRNIGAATGCRVRIYEQHQDWLATKITVKKPTPLPFWKAVDCLCAAGRFQYNLGMDGEGACISLFRDQVIGPTCDHGPFRVLINEAVLKDRQRKFHLPSGGVMPPRNDEEPQYYIGMSIMVEPRMMIRSGGPLKNVRAVDDQGRSLLAPGHAPNEPDDDFGFTSAAYVLAQVSLDTIAQPGRRVRTLRGVAPVVVARESESILVPIDGPAGRPYRCGESVVAIKAVRKVKPANDFVIEAVTPDGKPKKQDPGTPAIEIELSIKSADAAGNPRSAADLSEEQFAVIDAAGREWTPSPWWLSHSQPKHTGNDLVVRLAPVDPDMTPWRGEIKGAKLRYHEMAVATVDVPFEFHDLVLP